MLTLTFHRYSFQEFAYVSRESLMEITGVDWCAPVEFDTLLNQKALYKQTLLVPKLMGCDDFKSLRIKIIDSKERNIIRRWANNRPDSFGQAISQCGSVEFYFGSEPFDLDHKHSLGILVSYWARDPKVTKSELKYGFACDCLGVFGTSGYGSRSSVRSIGLNVFNKKNGRGTRRTRCSPLQAAEEIEQQQYFRLEYKNQLVQPSVRKIINEISNNVFAFARQSNPYYMRIVNRICTRQILTTGKTRCSV